MARSPRRKADVAVSEAWRAFWESPAGRTALAALFKEFGFYATPGADADLSRAWGQRDVLVRISQMINLKPEQAPADDGEVEDVFSHIMRMQ